MSFHHFVQDLLDGESEMNLDRFWMELSLDSGGMRRNHSRDR